MQPRYAQGPEGEQDRPRGSDVTAKADRTKEQKITIISGEPLKTCCRFSKVKGYMSSDLQCLWFSAALTRRAPFRSASSAACIGVDVVCVCVCIGPPRCRFPRRSGTARFPGDLPGADAGVTAAMERSGRCAGDPADLAGVTSGGGAQFGEHTTGGPARRPRDQRRSFHGGKLQIWHSSGAGQLGRSVPRLGRAR